MMFNQPNQYSLVSGAADSITELNAFDHALLGAGVGDTNLVKMSSILPPYCKCLPEIALPYGALVPVAYAAMTSSTPGVVISAAVAIAIPANPELPGLIMEHHGVGTLEETERQVREMAREGFRHRKRELREIQSIAVEHRVERHGAAFAGVVLWHKPEV